MASNVTTHYEIYQSYSAEELAAERADLIQRRKGYVSQAAGSKSYSQDLNRIDDMLQAVVRVQRERGQGLSGEDSRATADFSGARP